MGVRGELFSSKVILANRTYFFNVKENRMGDLYLNIVESKNRDSGGFDRQSVILFADDLQEFLKGFDESLKIMEKAVREKRRGGGDRSKRDEKSGESAEFNDERGVDRVTKNRGGERGFNRGSKNGDGERKFDRGSKSYDGERGFNRGSKSRDGERGFDRGPKSRSGERGFKSGDGESGYKRGPKSRDGERGFDRGAKSRSGERGFKGGFKSGGERGFDRGTKSRESGHGANRSRPGRSGPERGKPDRGSNGGKRVVVKKRER